MLLEFKIENYKSFFDESLLNMTKAPKQSGLDYSIMKERVGKKTYDGLCSSVIYGPNASGKTNIVGAVEVFKFIIQQGTINDSDMKGDVNVAKYMLNLIPNSMIKENNVPIKFYIKFINESKLFEYNLDIIVGNFMEQNFKRKIVKERLCVNELELFDREVDKFNVDINNLGKIDNIKDQLDNNARLEIVKNSLNDNELFLVSGYKTVYSPSIVNTFLNWVSSKLHVIYRADKAKLKYDVHNKEEIKTLDKSVLEAMRKFGDCDDVIGLFSLDGNIADKMISVINFKEKNNRKILPSEMYESYGTIRFVNLFPYILDALKTGMTLVVDELDASIHPMAVMNIINIFHNDDINKKHAQLIFNTHNPIYLDANLFRRDEIKFVEKDEKQHSNLYSLADFGTAGEDGVRKGEDYMKNYFVNRYGAIRNIDFSSIIEKEILKEGNQ